MLLDLAGLLREGLRLAPRCCGALLLAAFAVLSAPAPLSAQETSGTVIVLFDSSGSMWGNLPGGGGTKFEVAHSALANSLPDVTGGIRSGLMVFGPGCGRVTLASPPDLRDGAATVAPLQSLNPKSKGPVTAALVQSVDLLEAGQPAALLLVADGPDNCGQDLCAVAEQIAGERAGLKIHTIGLGLDQANPGLACASELTNGQYFSAPTAQDAETAIASAVNLALADLQVRETPKIASKPKQAGRRAIQIDPKGQPHLVLEAVLGKDGEAVEKPVRWQVYKSLGEPDAEVLPILDILEPRFAVPMAAGDYYIVAALGRAKFRTEIKVAEAGASSVKAVFDAGAVKLSVGTGQVPQQANGEPAASAATLITVRKAEDKSGEPPLIVSPYPEGELFLPAGRYEIVAESGLLNVKRVVDVAAGTRQDISFPLSVGELVLSADAPIEGVQSEDLEFIVSVDDPNRPGGRRRVARSVALNPSFGLPAATYYVEARSGLASVSDRVALGAGKRIEKSLSLDVARLEVETNAPPGRNARPQPIVYKLYQLDPLRAITRSSTRSPRFIVAPGRYRIVAEIGSRNVKAAEDIELVQGESRKVSLGVLAGDVRLNVTDQNGSAIGGQFWEVIDASGTVVWRTQLRSPQGLLAPGRYSVRCETRKGPVEGTFEVAAGEAKSVEFRVQ